MGTTVLDGILLEKLIEGGAANLSINASIVNDLNVFPIPDGDTGDNMCLTLNGGLRKMNSSSTSSLSDAAAALSQGMLMSARGNSGVILSQFFAGIAAGFKGVEQADVVTVGEALKSGVRRAYASVITPTEGTILTVARESVDYACSRITERSTLESFAADAMAELARSLQRTPDLLAVLKEAGVIDSGGAGLYYIGDGVRKTLSGETLESGTARQAAAPGAALDLDKFTENDVMEFGYCTEFLLRLTRSKTDLESFDIKTIIDFLSAIGDSIVATRSDSIVKIHVHTFTPEKVLDYCHSFGEFLTLKIENMTLQNHDSTVVNRFTVPAERKRLPFGIVTVASGEGVISTFKELGANAVIDGGQGKNPATQDFIDAFDEVNADTIFVLPNNGNIVLAAKQAAELYKNSDIRVIASKSIGDGYAALTMYSFDSGDPDQIENELREAMDGVVTGMLSKAVRSATVDGVEIREHEYFGFTDKNMLVSGGSRAETALALAEKLDAGSREAVIAVYGKDMSDTDRAIFEREMSGKYRRTEIYPIEGGQEVYDLILILQ